VIFKIPILILIHHSKIRRYPFVSHAPYHCTSDSPIPGLRSRIIQSYKGAMILTGLGFSELSVSIPSIAAVKAQLRMPRAS
jgi:hypothetical protein